MLELTNISKKFRDFSLENITFSVQKGDYFILLGESGSGKSMILETIAGLVFPDSGEIVLNGKDITRESIQKRKVGLVFQDHAVFPHMTARANIEYPLFGNKDEKQKKVSAIASQLEIEGILNRKPSTLSGGELQRVGLARTLVQEPSVLLLDEPLASLDIRLRSGIRDLLYRIHSKGQTIIHVTHDYEEAVSLGTRIAILDKGRIIQQGDPEGVFARPASEFVAHFTGARNFFRAAADPGTGGSMVKIADKIAIKTGEKVHGDGYVMIREEDIFLSTDKINSSAANSFEGIIEKVIPSSKGIAVVINAGITFHAVITKESAFTLKTEAGKKIWIHFKATAVRFISPHHPPHQTPI